MKTSKDFEDWEYCAHCDAGVELHKMDEDYIIFLICTRGHIFPVDDVRIRTAQDQHEDYGDMKCHEQMEES